MADAYPNEGGLRNFRQGDSKPIKGIVKKNGVPVSIAGWNIIFALKDKDTDVDISAHILKTAVLDPIETGEYLIDITEADTLSVPVNKYIWGIRIRDSFGRVQVLQEGTMWCLQPVVHTV